MTRAHGTFALLAAAVLVTAALSGCNDSTVRVPLQSVSERASPSVGSVIVYAAFGGTGQRFVFSVLSDGGGNSLLTAPDGDADITDDGGFHPTWHPNGSLVVYVGTAAGNNDIFTMSSSGGSVTPLTVDPASDMQPCVSPDGSKIAFVSNRAGTNDIWIMDSNGDNEVRVTNLASDDAEDHQWPCFDPTGAFIVYQSTEEDSGDPDAVDDTDIWVLTVATPATRTNLTPGVVNASDQGGPSWSPAPINTILFHDDKAGTFDIWAMPVDATGQPTGPAVQRMANPLSQGFPVWFPSGARFAFVEAKAIWTAAADGTDRQQVTQAAVQP